MTSFHPSVLDIRKAAVIIHRYKWEVLQALQPPGRPYGTTCALSSQFTAWYFWKATLFSISLSAVILWRLATRCFSTWTPGQVFFFCNLDVGGLIFCLGNQSRSLNEAHSFTFFKAVFVISSKRAVFNPLCCLCQDDLARPACDRPPLTGPHICSFMGNKNKFVIWKGVLFDILTCEADG